VTTDSRITKAAGYEELAPFAISVVRKVVVET
jgi:hypothetical protein